MIGDRDSVVRRLHARHSGVSAANTNCMLELYQTEGCPHSTAVRETMSEMGISYVLHNPRLPGDAGGDVTNVQTRDELVAIGGEDQIPLLVDHRRGETIYESDAIVEYLAEYYG